MDKLTNAAAQTVQVFDTNWIGQQTIEKRSLWNLSPEDRAHLIVPSNVRPQVVSALKATGKPVTDDNMRDLYLRTMGMGGLR